MKTNLGWLLALTALLAGCGTEAQEETKRPDAFELSETLYRELKLDTARTEVVKSELQLTGKVMPYENRLAKVAPLVDGVIEKLNAGLGDYVRRGQTLAILRSTDVADIENQIIASKSDLLTAQKNVQVTQDLAQSGLAADKDVVIAQNELKKAESSLGKASEVAVIYGVRNSRYTVRSPISGYIIDKNLTISEQMQYHEGETGPFFTVADLSEVQVVANVYESDIAKIKPGYEAEIRLLSYPDRVFRGRIDKISNILDPTTRTMPIRINLPNPGNLLKPEMFAQITIQFAGVNRMVTVPAAALLFDTNKNYVLVYRDRRHIEAREVLVSQNTGGRAYLTSGLRPGEAVLMSNQLLVFNALNQ